MNGTSFQCSMDSQGYKVKPSSEIGLINNRIGGLAKSVSQDNLKQFVTMVGNDGYAFSPATFQNGKRDKANFVQQQLFALDFDGGVSFEQVKDRSERYNLPMLFAYDTLSSENSNKFRVVYLNDASIPNKKTAEAMLKSLSIIFPETDKSCINDVSRIYYGGKELIYYDESAPEVNVESLFRNMSLCLKNRYGNTNYKRKLKEFSKSTGIQALCFLDGFALRRVRPT